MSLSPEGRVVLVRSSMKKTNDKTNVILIGMPGSGKSTVGVVLAKCLGYRFIDSDLVIQERHGKLLEELIRENGVEGFWKLENEVNASLEPEKSVIATGGSAVYGKSAMRHLGKIGTIVYLKLSCEEIDRRVGDLNARGVTVRKGQTLSDLYEERIPLYEKYADLTIECEGKQLREIVLEISGLLEKEKNQKGKKGKASEGETSSVTTTKAKASADRNEAKNGLTRSILKDKDIREPLFSFLEETFGKSRIIEEKTMGKSRADIVMVLPDALYGIEIKSDADTYARLERQIRDYDKYFDSNIVVVGTTHGEHIKEHVPEHWGIITVEEINGAFDFYFMRWPLPNSGVKWKKKLELLWRPELAQIQEWNDMPKYKNLGKAKVSDKILELMPERISEETLRRQVSDCLFERDYSKVAETLAEYRKSELDKQIEQETDQEKRLALIEKKEKAVSQAKQYLKPKPKRRYRRRRTQ